MEERREVSHGFTTTGSEEPGKDRLKKNSEVRGGIVFETTPIGVGLMRKAGRDGSVPVRL